MTVINIVSVLSADVGARKAKDLENYERQHGIAINYEEFHVTISNDSGAVCGVLTAYTAYEEIYIEDLWVDSVYRRMGYGKELVAALESRFKNRRYNNINLCTSNFRAPEFYRKCGFELEFIRENKRNPKLTKYFFVKYF